MKPGKRRAVSLEDLLRLKRMERPPEEFWSGFDRQLRAKQLSALVGRRPWWQDFTFSQILGVFRRYHLPLGAATVLAIGFASIRMHQSESAVAVGPMESPSIVAERAMPSLPGGIDAGSVQVVPEESEVVAGSVPADRRDSDLVAANDRPAPGALAPYIPLLGVGGEEQLATAGAHGLRYVEPALISTAATEPIIARTLLSSTSRLEVQAIPSRPAVEPLHQITPPSERRGTRILTAMVSMASVEHAMRTTERAASRLSEEQLYDQIHRFGARGAGVNVKF